MRAPLLAAWIVGAAVVAACAGDSSVEEPDERQPPAPVLPHDAADFAPAQVAIAGGGTRSGAELADVERCAPCHEEVTAAWRASAHAFASFQNPLYRVSVDGFRAARGNEASRFCGGCHDPALLVDGAMDTDVEPGDPRASAGVTCSVCHTVTEARPGGNAAYTLGPSPLPIPDLDDAASVAEHVRAATPAPLRTAALCATCHKAFLGEHTGHPHFISGADDALPWKRSAYAGSRAERVDEPVERAECRHCHMAPVEPSSFDVSGADGAVASHRFAGAHTLLAAMNRDEAQLRAHEALLVGAARVDVAAARGHGALAIPAERFSPSAGERVELDVVVSNLRVGHLFPGGTIDITDTWLEIEILDASGRRVASAGTDHEARGADPTAHRLRGELIDEEGLPVRAHEVERFRALAYSHAVPARDASVVRYAFQAPSASTFEPPLSVRARVRHRGRSLELADAACRDAATPRGRAFGAVSALDPCVTPPVVDVADVVVILGSEAPPAGSVDLGTRLADHGRALLKSVQEESESARPSLLAALDVARAKGDAVPVARALSLLGELEARQGRTQAALDRFAEAEAWLPGHPALALGRGRALASVWRFPEAAPHFEAAARGAPKDDGPWAWLATTRGSAGDPEGALDAAVRGLLEAPRSADLLRSQALALRRLAPEGPLTTAADDVHLAHRSFDDAPRLRAACDAKVPGCALERTPVHVHEMKQAR